MAGGLLTDLYELNRSRATCAGEGPATFSLFSRRLPRDRAS